MHDYVKLLEKGYNCLENSLVISVEYRYDREMLVDENWMSWNNYSIVDAYFCKHKKTAQRAVF